MNCDQFSERLDDYLDATLNAPATQALEAHVASCAVCHRRLGQAMALMSALRDLPVDPPAADFESRALQEAIAPRPRRGRGRAARLIGAALAAGLAASIVALVYTGPTADRPADTKSTVLPTVAMTVEQPRTINLVFAANMPLEDVSLQVVLPPGIEIPGYEGQREVVWHTSLRTGKNVLPLELVARDRTRGEIVARMRSGEQEKVFTLSVTAAPG